MRRFLRRFMETDASGATALEFALLLPVLTMLMFGIVDIGLMMITAEDVAYAADIATRQLRTGAVQEAPVPSTPATAAQCLNPSYNAVENGQNCLGITINTGDTPQTIFKNLLCASIPDGGNIAQCSKFNFDIVGYADWTTASSNISTLALTYNGSGVPQVSMAAAPGKDSIVISMIGYKYQFFTPMIGCIFDSRDCGSAVSPYVLLTHFTIFQTEPFSSGATG